MSHPRFLLRVAAFSGALLLLPASVGNGGLATSGLCAAADGQCAFELGSRCERVEPALTDHYWKE